MKYLLTFLLLTAGSAAQADHTIAIYAVDGHLSLPHQSHLFALIDGKHSISWLPRDGIIRPMATRPEPGKNFSFDETLHWSGERPVTLVGKAKLTDDQYRRALKHIAALENGDFSYKMLDTRFRPEASNCIHAISTIAGSVDTGIAYGTRSGERVLELFEPPSSDAERAGPLKTAVEFSKNVLSGETPLLRRSRKQKDEAKEKP